MGTDEENIDLIMRQTSYTKEEATKHYLNYQKNCELVIKKFLGIQPEKKNSQLTTNQERMKQFRIIMQTTKDAKDLSTANQ